MDSYHFGNRIDAIVAAHARTTPDAVAVRQGAVAWTYAELDRRADLVAAGLREQAVRPGGVVPMLMDRSTDLVAVMVGIMRAGCASACLDPRWPVERLADVIGQCGAPVVVADQPGPGRVTPEQLYGSGAVRADQTDHAGRTTPAASADLANADLGNTAPADTAPADTAPADTDPAGIDPACVFFTSGSTGRPKGVLAPHRGLVRSVVGNPALPFGPHTVQLAASPLPWDGFASEWLAPLLHGGCCVMADRGPEPLDPDQLRRQVAGGVNSLLIPAALFGIIAEEDVEALAGVECLFVGGDRLSVPAARRVLQRFPDLRLVNAYGPAENSIMTTVHVVRPADVVPDATDIPIGEPLPLTTVVVVDDAGAPVPPGVVGELVTGGDGLAIGYLGDPAETARRFFDTADGPLPPGRYYRTGDLAVRDEEGLLRYRGRVDRQLKLNGIRIEPAEVEAVLETHPQVTGCLVFLVETAPGRKQLACLYTTADGEPITAEDFRQTAGSRLLATMVPAIWQHTDRLPMSTMDKVDVEAARRLVAAAHAAVGDAAGTAPVPNGDPLLEELAVLLGQPGLAADADLLDAGLTSLDAVRLATRLAQRWQRPVSSADVFRLRTVEAVRRRAFERPAGRRTPPPTPVPAVDHAPLTRAQRRQLFAEWVAPGDMDNVVVEVYHIRGPLDPDVLDAAVCRAVARHTSLRTCFPVVEGMPVQHVVPADELPSPLSVVAPPEDPGGPLEAVAQAFAEGSWGAGPFHLDRELPIRARLCRLEDERHLLALQVHHIAIDGRSEPVVLHDIMSGYADVLAGRPPRPPAELDYASFGEWERTHLDAWTAAGADHWLKVLADAPPAFLPSPPPGGQVESRCLTKRIDADTVAGLARAAAARGGPPVSGLIAAAGLAMGRELSVSDLCLGTITDGRIDPAIDEVVGYFVNPLAIPLRGVLRSSPGQVLAQTAESVVSALEYATTPFDELVRILRPPRDRHPWFQAFTVLQGPRVHGELAAGVVLNHVPTQPTMTRREWTLQSFPQADGSWYVTADGRRDTLSDDAAAGVMDGLEAAIAELAALG
ncbi:mycobactin peptide synthetase MbtE [Catenulispora sp. GP43]|uniref:amino acid adenylation domain-containing protein n=1 Tax=Catenulispora sp. GP43 TaxID=3156263 RepID=UPI003510F3CF